MSEQLSILELVAKINKDLKLDSVMPGEGGKPLNVERISSGSLSYDYVTGGGFPLGRWTNISGVQSSGKTTISLLNLVQYQKSGDPRYALILDAEYAFASEYAKALGVDMSRVIFFQPDDTNQAHSVLMECLKSNSIGWFLLDSIAACQPASVLENEADSSNIGVHAKAIGNIHKAANSYIGKNKVLAITINQVRDKIGGYGGGVTLPGGHAPNFYASIQMQVNRGSKVENPDGTFTNRGSVSVTKNKVAPPYLKAEYDMEHGTGISVAQEILDFGTRIGILYKKGHAFYYDSTLENNEEKRSDHLCLGRGKAEAKQFLEDNVEFREEMFNLISRNLFNN